ncbi:MAG: M23 family metallopeptidase [Synechococcaceae cyanobacterium SM2_3_1]|nr:M23 family metallopeptidase [Synechococcaceae cyanobacterium SM2_3_1]
MGTMEGETHGAISSSGPNQSPQECSGSCPHTEWVIAPDQSGNEWGLIWVAEEGEVSSGGSDYMAAQFNAGQPLAPMIFPYGPQFGLYQRNLDEQSETVEIWVAMPVCDQGGCTSYGAITFPLMTLGYGATFPLMSEEDLVVAATSISTHIQEELQTNLAMSASEAMQEAPSVSLRSFSVSASRDQTADGEDNLANRTRRGEQDRDRQGGGGGSGGSSAGGLAEIVADPNYKAEKERLEALLKIIRDEAVAGSDSPEKTVTPSGDVGVSTTEDQLPLVSGGGSSINEASQVVIVPEQDPVPAGGLVESVPFVPMALPPVDCGGLEGCSNGNPVPTAGSPPGIPADHSGSSTEIFSRPPMNNMAPSYPLTNGSHFTDCRAKCSRLHVGLDVYSTTGDNRIFSGVENAQVITAGSLPGGGNSVRLTAQLTIDEPIQTLAAEDSRSQPGMITIPPGEYTVEIQYHHLSSINVVEGQIVNANTVVGIMGNTGSSSGPHLDIKVIVYGIGFIDPVSVLDL